MNGFTFTRTATALALVAGLAACKSNRACSTNTCATPQPAPCAPPTYTYAAPAPSYPAPQPSYGPPPEIVYAPSQSSADADMTARALEAERKAREVAEERARQAEEMLKLASTQPVPAGGGATWPSVGGGANDALAFAEELRTKTNAEVVQTGSSVVVRFTDAFRPGSDQMKADVQQATTLHAVADALMRYPGAQVAVIGHTDSQPINKSRAKWTDNTHLSRARAEAVARVLGDKGLDGSRVMVDGRGDSEPLVYPERTSTDRSRNRRVEMHVRF